MQALHTKTELVQGETNSFSAKSSLSKDDCFSISILVEKVDQVTIFHFGRDEYVKLLKIGYGLVSLADLDLHWISQ